MSTEQTSPPIERIAEAALNTISAPTPAVLVEDLILVHQLATEVKAKLAGKHPTILTILRLLF